jgi:hypothetical protein
MAIFASDLAAVGLRSKIIPNLVARIGLGDRSQDNARSGYWRLFFTQMQEDALNESNKTETVSEESGSTQPHQTPAKVHRTPKRKKVKQSSVPKHEVRPKTPSTFNLPIVVANPSAYEQLAELPILPTITYSLSTYQQIGVIIDLDSVRRKRRQRARRRAAAFLLMAA